MKAGLGLAEAKALVEGAPKPVLEGANKADSDAAKKKLEDAGAKAQSLPGPLDGGVKDRKVPDQGVALAVGTLGNSPMRREVPLRRSNHHARTVLPESLS